MPHAKPAVLEQAQSLGFRIYLEGEGVGYDFKGSQIIGLEKAKEIVDKLKQHKREIQEYLLGEKKRYENILAIDIETTGLNPLKNDIRLISQANDNEASVTEKIDDLRQTLKDPLVTKVFHNVSFDVPFLHLKGYEVNNYTDSMLMSQLLGDKGEKHNLTEVVKRELGIELDKSLQKESNWKGKITDKHLEYSKKDAQVTLEVAKKLLRKIESRNLLDELRRNERALPFAIRAKVDGIPFDKEGWLEQLEVHNEEKEAIAAQILKELNSTINLNAPPQVKQALRNRGIALPDTKDETLAAFEDQYEIIKKIRKYRELQKLVSTSGKNLLNCVDPDGRIRANWNINGSITGRMSCSGPNIQQIDHRIRSFFKASTDHMFIDCDYSQIELRVVAAISGDKEMINAFRNGEDLHIKTARMIFAKEEVSKEERQIAKTCNFGLIYGMSAKGLKQRLKQTCNMDISERQAELFRERFFKLYKGVKKWQVKTYRKNRVQTLGGKSWFSKDLTYTDKYNYPVQGSAAEGLKEAMALVIEEIPAHWKICAVIHDEILLEVPVEEAQLAKEKLETWMVQGMSKIVGNVPIVAEAGISNIWEKA